MACSCNKKINTSIKSNSDITRPYTSCIYCTTKHLAYAVALYEEHNERYLANLYLAYLHSRVHWKELSSKIVNLLISAFNDIFVDLTNELDAIMHEAHELASEDNQGVTYKGAIGLSFSRQQLAFLLALTAQELYNYEVGYKHTNTPYVLGLLQSITVQFHEERDKELCRSVWKAIEKKDTEVLSKFKELLDLCRVDVNLQ